MRNGAWLGRVPIRGLGVNAASDADLGVLTTAQAAVVDCWQPGCVPCEQYKPAFDAVATAVPRDVMMVSVNVAEAPQFASRYQIESTPTTLFLSTGNEVNRIEGKISQDELLAAVQSAFNLRSSTPASQQQAPAPTPTTTPPAPTPTVKPSQATPKPTVIQASSGPSTTAIVAGVAGIALALAGFALIVGKKG